MKRCARCKDTKPLVEFYRHPKTSDGRGSYCKPCQKAIASRKNMDKETLEKRRAYVRGYNKRLYVRARYRRWKRANKEKVVRWNRERLKKRIANGKEAEYRRRPDQRLRQGAHLMVGAALRLGVLRKRPCRCGTREVQAHHEDYSRPLKVMWLCAACHARHHQHLRTKGVGVMQRFLALRL